MTDRDKLVSVRDQLIALAGDLASYLDPPVDPPQDCVLSEWSEWTPTSDWTPCNAEGKQKRTELRTRTVVTPPANGGAPCGELFESREVWRDCAIVEPPPPPPDGWPPFFPDEPTKERKAEIKAGKGYPEKRVYIEAQWHDSESQDVNNMRHIHCGAAIPPVLTSRIWQLDILNTAFHFQGGVFQGIRGITHRTNTPVPKWMPVYDAGRDGGRRTVLIPEGAEGHLLEWWTPAFLDLATVVVPDRYTFEIDSQTRRPDGRIANVRMVWRTVVDLTGAAPIDVGGRNVVFEGWVSPQAGEGNQFGYLSVSMNRVRFFASDPVQPITLSAQAKAGRQVRVMVCKNPNLHAHPADYGEIVFDQTYVSEKRNFVTTFDPPDLAVGDRLMARIVDASDPDIGSGATLGVVTLADG